MAYETFLAQIHSGLEKSESPSGGFTNRVPPTVVQYGYNDSVLVAKTVDFEQVLSYYIIDMQKDSESADEANFRIGPLSEKKYDEFWQSRLNIKFRRTY